MSGPVYRYYVTNLLSDELVLELPFRGVSWSRKIRRGGEFSGYTAILSDDAAIDVFWGTMPGRCGLYVTRNEIPVWGGIINSRDYQVRQGVVTLGALSFEAYLYHRFIWSSVSYPNTVDQYQVVRNLINLMQSDFDTDTTRLDDVETWPSAADTNIRVQPGDSGKSQDTLSVSGYDLKTFGETIEEFSNNLGGFEYNIEIGWNETTNKFTRTLVFRDTPPGQIPQGETFTGERIGLNTNIIEYPGNVIDVSLSNSIEDSATRYYVTGKAPEGSDAGITPVPRGVWENRPYLSTGWPILEVVESSKHSEVRLQSTLNNYARRYGRQVRPPISTWTITLNGSVAPEIGSYVPGDWCRFITTDPFLLQRLKLSGEFDTGMIKRISDYTVTVPDVPGSPEVVAINLFDEWSDEGDNN